MNLDPTQAPFAQIGVDQVTFAQPCIAQVGAGHPCTCQHHAFKHAGIDLDARRMELGERGVGQPCGLKPMSVECRYCVQNRRQVGRVWSYRSKSSSASGRGSVSDRLPGRPSPVDTTVAIEPGDERPRRGTGLPADTHEPRAEAVTHAMDAAREHEEVP